MSKKVAIRIILLFLITIMFFVAIHRHLFGDGSFYLMKILTQEEFFIPHQARFLAIVIKELLPVLLVKAGTTNISFLSFAYGLNHFLIPLFSFALSLWICRTEKKPYLIAIVFSSYAFLFCNTSLNITSETHVAGAIFWPTFLTVYNQKRYLFAAIGIILLWFSYEGSFILLSVILFALLIKSHESHRRYPLLGLCMIGIVITLYFTLFPHDQAHIDNRYYSITRVLYLFGYITFWLSLILVFSPLLILIKNIRINSTYLILICSLSGALYLLWPFLTENSLNPTLHYFGRVLNVFVPAFLGILILLNERYQYLNNAQIIPIKFFAIVTIITVLNQLNYSIHWHQYMNHFRNSIKVNYGIVDYDNSLLNQDAESMVFHKDWATPTMSVLIQIMYSSEIKTIIKNGKPDIWQPWNPQDKNSWPDLSKYNVTYDLSSSSDP